MHYNYYAANTNLTYVNSRS